MSDGNPIPPIYYTFDDPHSIGRPKLIPSHLFRIKFRFQSPWNQTMMGKNYSYQKLIIVGSFGAFCLNRLTFKNIIFSCGHGKPINLFKLTFNLQLSIKMKVITFIGIFIFSFCHLVKGEFEERSDLSFQIRAIYQGEGVKIFLNYLN